MRENKIQGTHKISGQAKKIIHMYIELNNFVIYTYTILQRLNKLYDLMNYEDMKSFIDK